MKSLVRGVCSRAVAGLAAFSGLGLNIAAAEGPYDGHRVYRVTVDTPKQLLAVTSLADVVWSCHVGLGSVDVQLSPEKAGALAELGLEHRVMIEDVQALIDGEARQIEAARRQRDAAWFNTFRTLAEVSQRLDQFAAQRPDLASTFVAGQSLEGRPIRGIRFSSPDLPGNPRASRPIVCITGTQHAREWISPMTSMWVADRFIESYNTDARLRGILDRVEIIILPVVNPDGYEFSWQAGNRLWRKNRRANGDGSVGVDLNRNWGYQWGGEGASATPSNDTFRGAGPFSEPETQVVSAFITSETRIRGHIDFHSYGQLILSPWGYTSAPHQDSVLFDDASGRIDSAIETVNGFTYTDGPSYTTIYPASGVVPDWCYGARGIMSWTIELRDTGQTGFVLPADQIIPTATEAFEGVVTLCEFSSEPVWIATEGALPVTLAPGQASTVRFRVKNGASTLAGTPVLRTRVIGQSSFASTPLADQGGGVFSGELPGLPCRQSVEYYVEAVAADGRAATFPRSAPVQVFSAPARETIPTFADGMETDLGWVVGAPGDAATLGIWERADPQATTAQPGDDVSNPGVLCWVTGPLAGSGVGAFDVDGGATTLTSPNFSALAPAGFSGGEARVGYARWYSNERGSAPFEDTLLVQISRDAGATWQTLEQTGENARAWVTKSFRIADVLAPSAQMRLRFVASDVGAGSVVEAAVDEVRVTVTGCTRTADFDGDGDVGTDADIEAFFACLGGNCCATCDSADFDGDGDVGTDADIEEFFRVLGGG